MPAPTCIELTFPRSVTSEQVIAFWSGVAAALTVGHGVRRRPSLVVEVLAAPGRIRHLVHAQRPVLDVVQQQLAAQLPGVRWEATEPPEVRVDDAAELRLSARERSLRIDRAGEVSAAVLTALAAVQPKESLILQWVLSGGAPARATHQPKESREIPSCKVDVRQVAGDLAREVRSKALEPQLLGVCRIGVEASTPERCRLLVRGVLGALRGSDAPGVRTLVRLLPGACHRSRLLRRTVPTFMQGVFNGAEVAARVPFPIDGPQVPGLLLGGSRLLVPARTLCSDPSNGATLALTSFPGTLQRIVMRDRDRLEHLHVIGPTGTGKSTLLANVAVQDIERGHCVIVIDPKGDLVDDVLDRLPKHRTRDVILLDPADTERPVGYNPLATDGRSLDLVSDSITSVFNGLFSQFWGPRSDDILRSSLMTLGLASRSPSEAFTLCEVPALLTDKAFRKSVTASLDDPIALEPFWAVYEGMRAAERAQAISPLLNKLRAFLLRKSLRSMLGQSEPRWSIEAVMAERKILLVSLRAGLIGEEAAQLLGSLVVARIWQATLARSVIPRESRSPVMVLLDEFHTLIHLPTSLGELLAQARGLGVGLTLAHQHFGQLTPELRRDVLANARSRVIFQQGIEDARLLARGLPELEPEDLQGLPSREVVISLTTNAEVQPAVTGKTLPLVPPTGTADQAREFSRMRYGTPAQAVEDALLRRRGQATTAAAGKPSAKRRQATAKPVQIGEVPDEEGAA